MPTVYIIIYSLYHHIYKVAKSVEKGLVDQGVTVKMFQVPETLPDDVLEKMHAPPKPDLPVISVEDLSHADGFLFGIPTRFGTMPSQIKSFLDATGGLWANGTLAGKFAGTFFSTASQHGGQETTAYTLVTYFAHHGMMYIPLGFANSNLFDTTEVVGGSPYGAGTVANGDGSREPTEKELAIAVTQGENYAKILNTYHHGMVLAAKENEQIVVEDVEPPAVVSGEVAPQVTESNEAAAVSQGKEFVPAFSVTSVPVSAQTLASTGSEQAVPVTNTTNTDQQVVVEENSKEKLVHPTAANSDSLSINPVDVTPPTEQPKAPIQKPEETTVQQTEPTATKAEPAVATNTEDTTTHKTQTPTPKPRKVEEPKKKHKCFCM